MTEKSYEKRMKIYKKISSSKKSKYRKGLPYSRIPQGK